MCISPFFEIIGGYGALFLLTQRTVSAAPTHVSGAELGGYALHFLLGLGAKGRQGGDHDQRDQSKNQSVLGQALAALILNELFQTRPSFQSGCWGIAIYLNPELPLIKAVQSR